jgi:hypothetical protein
MNYDVPRFLTIRKTAETGILPEHCLRRMQKNGELPCIYSGTRCLVNYDKLVRQLNAVGDERESRYIH